MTAASPAEQTFRAGQPTREAVQSNAPRNVALGAAGVAVPAGMIREGIESRPIPTYEPLQGYGQRYADWKAMQVPQDYVGDAGFDVGPAPAQTDISAFSREDYVPPSYGKVPDILAPVAGGGANRAVQTARSVGTRSTPTQIATAAADNPTGGFFSRLSNAIYDPNYQKGMSSKQMFEQMQRDPRGELSFAQEESPAAYARAAQRAREEGEGRASGGKAGNGVPKDAALHKALEIIHRLISR
jgi:hypothetical protein